MKQESLHNLLEKVSRQSSTYGGGSLAACSAASAAALLDKLITRKAQKKRLKLIRRSCLTLIDRDAKSFGRVIELSREKDRKAFIKALKSATNIPLSTAEYGAEIQRLCHSGKKNISPQYRSDLECVLLLAKAAQKSAQALIDANLSWIKDTKYSKQVRTRLIEATRKSR